MDINIRDSQHLNSKSIANGCTAFINNQEDHFLATAALASTFEAERLLLDERQEYSAAINSGRIYAMAFIFLALIGIVSLLSEIASTLYFVIACIIGAPITFFRLFAALKGKKDKLQLKNSATLIAPIYTILIAVYREANVIDTLIGAIEKLNWPKDKLDLIFICESDDHETIEKIKSINTSLNYRLLCLADGPIKTKPRALQAGLSFARGRFLTVFDAEDSPHPNQLREAYDLFMKSDEKLGVIQAPLIAWNNEESWISGQFALEYAVWFQVVLPALEKISGYLPLGGTSNHFRTSALREVGGWDPYNVTEDADLGARLCRYGYYAKTIGAPTFEEAPPKISSWIRQRSRWMHGHLQTMAVHFRNAKKCAGQMGKLQFAAFAFSITSGPLNVALRLPMAIYSVYGALFLDWPIAQILILFFLIGAEILINLVAIVRDKRTKLLVVLISLPIYWIMQIPAFCRALFNIIQRPYYWEKTDHGIDAR